MHRRFAAFAAQARSAHARPLFAASLLAFLVLGVAPQAPSVASLCGQLDLAALVQLTQLRLVLQSPWHLAADWTLMVVAMMVPLAAPQVAHVWRSSLPARRYSATLVMLAFYLSCWVLAGIFLLPLAASLSIALAGQVASLGVAVVLASIWSASPLAQRARNRCHMVRGIRPFGARAYLDSARLGLATGAACIIGCWPWMLVPLTVEDGHFLAMLVVAIYIFAERIAPAARPSWGWPPAWETLLGTRGLKAPPNPAEYRSAD